MKLTMQAWQETRKSHDDIVMMHILARGTSFIEAWPRVS
jgi:hypothetical protein